MSPRDTASRDALDALESQSVFILREAFNKFARPCVLWSLGKDSNVMLWLIRKAFLRSCALSRRPYRHRPEISRDVRIPGSLRRRMGS